MGQYTMNRQPHKRLCTWVLAAYYLLYAASPLSAAIPFVSGGIYTPAKQHVHSPDILLVRLALELLGDDAGRSGDGEPLSPLSNVLLKKYRAIVRTQQRAPAFKVSKHTPPAIASAGHPYMPNVTGRFIYQPRGKSHVSEPLTVRTGLSPPHAIPV